MIGTDMSGMTNAQVALMAAVESSGSGNNPAYLCRRANEFLEWLESK